MFSFTYKLDDNDYYEFNKYHMYNAPANKKRIKFLRIVYPCFFVLCGLLLGSRIEYPMLSYVVFGAIAVIWAVFFKSINNRTLKKNMARMKKAGKMPYQPNITLTFFDDYFYEKTEMNETKTDYSMIEHIDDTATGVYIYTGAISAFIVPNTAFADSSERAALIAYLQTKTMKRG